MKHNKNVIVDDKNQKETFYVLGKVKKSTIDFFVSFNYWSGGSQAFRYTQTPKEAYPFFDYNMAETARNSHNLLKKLRVIKVTLETRNTYEICEKKT